MGAATVMRPTSPPELAAHLVSTLLAPVPLAAALPIAIGWHAAGWYGGMWGVVPAVFTGILPYLHARRLRRAQAATVQAGGKPPRQVAVALVSLLIGVAALVIGQAPREVLAADVALLCILLVTAPITIRWDISYHAAVAAGAVVVCCLAYTVPLPGVTALIAGMVAVGWSRLRLASSHHAEVVVGALVGAAVCGLSFAFLA